MNEPTSAKQEIMKFINEIINLTNKETDQPEILSLLNRKADKLLSWLEGFDSGTQHNKDKK